MKKYIPEILTCVKVCGNDHTWCGHPVQAGEICYFGNGEIAFMHLHADDVDYDDPKTNLGHGQTGIHGKCVVKLTRSYDGGYTWKEEDSSIVFGQAWPVEEQEKLINNIITEENAQPLTEDTIFHWDMCFCGPLMKDGVRRQMISFMRRSEDKGHTWSDSVMRPDNIGYTALQHASGPVIRQEGRMLKPFGASIIPDVDNVSPAAYRAVLYASENDGVNWRYVSDIARDITGEDSHSYCTVQDMGEGHLVAFTGSWRAVNADTRWICCCHSYDNGLNWTLPKRIQSFGTAPYSVKLRDGRILVLYCRRDPVKARGIFGMISDDQGQTWSEEFAIRRGATTNDIGYPIAIETEDNHIFVGYYYVTEEFGIHATGDGPMFIEGTLFKI